MNERDGRKERRKNKGEERRKGVGKGGREKVVWIYNEPESHVS